MNFISFSLWGQDERFLNGALENIRLAPAVYPDWKVLICLDSASPTEWWSRLRDAGAMVTLYRSKDAWHGLFWRFEPISSALTDYVIVRDCDSRISPREAAAVKEWMDSGKLFHSMRDHYEHAVPIMGGMFGCRQWPRFVEIMNTWTDFSRKGIDQDFLRERIWPEVREHSITHDRYATGLDMPNRNAPGRYQYDPKAFFGPHDVRFFPDHPYCDESIYGAHVGARVGVEC